MHTRLYSHNPHFPSSRESSRKSANTIESRQIYGNGVCVTFPDVTGRYPHGKTSPVCDTKQTACPARQPLVIADMSACPAGREPG